MLNFVLYESHFINSCASSFQILPQSTLKIKDANNILFVALKRVNIMRVIVLMKTNIKLKEIKQYSTCEFNTKADL